jgi:hypothetical protein
MGFQWLVDAKFVTGMRPQGIVRHHLIVDLLRQRRIKTTSDVDRRQLAVLALIVRLKLPTFKRKVSLFGVRLRVHRNVAGGHRHRAGD